MHQSDVETICFVCVAFGDQYVEQQKRLRESILNFYPSANLKFWTNSLPKNSKPFLDSLYGFKPHAIQEAIDAGFKKVIWLDPAMIMVNEIDNRILSQWLIAVRDDHKLHNLVSNRACAFFNTTHYVVETLEWRLVGGSFYYFNFHDMRVRSIFDLWKRSEEAGCFGSQYEAASEQLQGHRYDETCLALAMQGHHMFPQPGPDVGYCIENNAIFIKKHFK